MNIQLIRNATMILMYAGRVILTDPMLSTKGEIRSFAGIAQNPTVELPMPAKDVIKGIDSVLVSHVHPDHFDKPGSELLPKEIPLFCQPEDKNRMTEEGFRQVIPVVNSFTWEGITIIRTGGKHGSGNILERMGTVSGFVLQAKGEPTVYWVGDSIWCEEVENTIKTYKPDVIITHSGGATIPGFEPIIMDANQTLKVLNAAPNAKVVAIHTESLDHCTVTRKMLREMSDREKILSTRFLIPNDGEKISLEK